MALHITSQKGFTGMIWLTWRQHRLEAAIGMALLGLISLTLLVTGLHMASVYQDTGVAACAARDVQGGPCQGVEDAFIQRFADLGGLYGWLSFLPLVLGVLLAAPFVLDLDHGTNRLAWTQSITRTRRLAVKLSLLVATAFLTGVALAAIMSWWRQPLDPITGRLNANAFDVEGVTPACARTT